MDGMVLPDGTPMPSLAEFAAVNQPIVFGLDGETLRVRNRYHTLSTDHLRFIAILEVEGDEVRASELAVPEIAPGATASLSLPAEILATSESGENWLNVRAELVAETAWAPAGHVVARAQFELTAAVHGGRTAVSAASPEPAGELPPVPGPAVQLGDAEFDPLTGRLRRLFGLSLDGPQLELWRRPDNDRRSARLVRARQARGHRRGRRARPVVGAALAASRAGPARRSGRRR